MPDDATPETVPNRRGLAGIFGLSDVGRISKYVASGMPVRSDGGFNVEDCIRWRFERIGKTTADDAKRLLRWKAVHEKEKAKLCRVRRRQLEGSVVDIGYAYSLFRPAVVAMGGLAQTLIDHADTLPEDSPIQDAVMAVIREFSAIQEHLSEKIAKAPISTPVPNRFKVVADKLGIGINV